MKNLLPVLLFILVVGGVVWFVTRETPTSTSSAGASTESAGLKSDAEGGTGPDGMTSDVGSDVALGDGEGEEEMIRPAAEVYKSAAEALEAIKKGAGEYDDVILEQFTLPGEDCSWCDDFYGQLRSMLAAADVTDDQRSYYAEVLAISGRSENIGTLINAARNATKPEEINSYLEALELTVGNDAVVKFLGSQLDGSTESIKESLVAAITNQGTRSAAEILVKESEKTSDPEAFYNKGIGLGEFIPEPEAYPPLQDIIKKRDPKLAPLATKALLNAGIDGLRIVFDELASDRDQASAQNMIKGAIDHVSYDEEVESYLKQMSEKGNATQKEFASNILKDFQQSQEEISQAEEAQ